MKALVCTDSFKGTLSSVEAARIITGVLLENGIQTEYIPIADGGEGTVDALIDAAGGEKIPSITIDALGRKIDSYFGRTDNTGFLEAALSCGITFLKESELNPMRTTSAGLGKQILEAVNCGCEKLYIGIGGTTTNDMGIGMLADCGAKFFDNNGELIKREYDYGYTASDLQKIYGIEFNPGDVLTNLKITVLSDVKNPLYGKEGATYVYGPQKGADENMVRTLDKEIKRVSEIVSSKYKTDPDFPGAGAAGGLGFTFKVFFNAEIISGIDGIIRLAGIEEKIKQADFVIVGEGSMDAQSAYGKAPVGIASISKKYSKPVYAIVGRADESVSAVFEKGIDSVFAGFEKVSTPDPETLKGHAKTLLSDNTKNFIKYFTSENDFKNKIIFLNGT